MAKPKVPRWFYLVLFVGTAAACLLAAEIAVRLTWARDYPRRDPFYEYQSAVGLVHRPGHYQLPFVRCLVDKPCENVTVNFNINRQGFRGPDFREPRGHPLIAVIGDSQIEGQQVDDEQLATARLQELLKPGLPDVEVRNFAITSAGFVHYYATWSKYIAAQRPDVLIIAPIGGNDFRNCSTKLETFAPMRPHYTFAPDGTRQVHFAATPNSHSQVRLMLSRQWDKLELVRFLRWFSAVRQEEKRAIKVGDAEIIADISIYENPPNADYAEAAALGQEYLQRLIREANATGTKVIVAALPWRDEALDEEWSKQQALFTQSGRTARLERQRPENIIRATTQAQGAQFLSFAEAVHKLPPAQQRSLWHKDDLHMTAQGQQFLAETLAPLISPTPARQN